MACAWKQTAVRSPPALVFCFYSILHHTQTRKFARFDVVSASPADPPTRKLWILFDRKEDRCFKNKFLIVLMWPQGRTMKVQLTQWLTAFHSHVWDSSRYWSLAICIVYTVNISRLQPKWEPQTVAYHCSISTQIRNGSLEYSHISSKHK